MATGAGKTFTAITAVYRLMNIVGPPLGQVSVVPADFGEWNINHAIAIFRAVEGISPRWRCIFLLSPTCLAWLKKRAKTTAGQTNLTLEVCRSLPIPLPPRCEHAPIIDLIDGALVATTAQEEALKFGLKQVAAQRKNILKAAFSGQLVPQDRNDEPASALLERIRAERAAGGKPAKPRKAHTARGVA